MLAKNKQQITKAADACMQIGDECHSKWKKDKDLNTAKVAIGAYKEVLNANKLILASDQLAKKATKPKQSRRK